MVKKHVKVDGIEYTIVCRADSNWKRWEYDVIGHGLQGATYNGQSIKTAGDAKRAAVEAIKERYGKTQ
jgi:hypothetical protein